MIPYSVAVLLALGLWTAHAGTVKGGYPPPGNCAGDCFAHDPALARRDSDGVYFRFNTGNGIGIYKSTHLTGPWAYRGKVLPSGSSIKLAGNKDLWVCVAIRRPCKLPRVGG